MRLIHVYCTDISLESVVFDFIMQVSIRSRIAFTLPGYICSTRASCGTTLRSSSSEHRLFDYAFYRFGDRGLELFRLLSKTSVLMLQLLPGNFRDRFSYPSERREWSPNHLGCWVPTMTCHWRHEVPVARWQTLSCSISRRCATAMF